MSYFILLDSENKIISKKKKSIHKDISDDYIEITNEQYQAILDNRYNTYVNGVFSRIDRVMTPEEIEHQKQQQYADDLKHEAIEPLINYILNKSNANMQILEDKILEIKARYGID